MVNLVTFIEAFTRHCVLNLLIFQCSDIFKIESKINYNCESFNRLKILI